MTPSFSASHRGGSGSPMLLLHGFTDTWRTWELVLPALEAEHDVLAITLPGHAGGSPLPEGFDVDSLVDGVEAVMDEAGFDTAHIVGSSLGGYLALHLAARGRATSVVLLAPAGGWALDDLSGNETIEHFLTVDQLVKAAAPHVDAVIASPEGRRVATAALMTNYEHLEPEFVGSMMLGSAACTAVAPLVEYVRREGWTLDGSGIDCPVRVVWGTEDQLLKWPSAAARYRDEWVPGADWVVLDGIGHLIQIDVPEQAAKLILEFAASAEG